MPFENRNFIFIYNFEITVKWIINGLKVKIGIYIYIFFQCWSWYIKITPYRLKLYKLYIVHSLWTVAFFSRVVPQARRFLFFSIINKKITIFFFYKTFLFIIYNVITFTESRFFKAGFSSELSVLLSVVFFCIIKKKKYYQF